MRLLGTLVFCGFIFLAFTFLGVWMVREEKPLTPTLYEQLTMLPVYIQSAERKERRCSESGRGGRSYVCDEYYELKATHQTKKHSYTLRLIGLGGKGIYRIDQSRELNWEFIKRANFLTNGKFRLFGREVSLSNRKVNVWVDKNNHWLLYQAALVFDPVPRPQVKWDRWKDGVYNFNPPPLQIPQEEQEERSLYEALRPGKTDNERLILSYEDTLQRLSQNKYRSHQYRNYLISWLVTLFFAALSGASFWEAYQQWRKVRSRPFPAENPFR